VDVLHAARLAVVVCVVFAGRGGSPASAGEDRHGAFEPILKAWREREAKADSVRFAWTEKRQFTRGSLMPPEGLGEPAASKGLPFCGASVVRAVQ
jgi:hypothetical protein